jgi:hypothetical protein
VEAAVQAHNLRRIFKWLYFAVLLAATAAGAWLGYPSLEQFRAERAAALKVDVYAHPFVSFLKDTPIGAQRSSSLDTFFNEDIVNRITADILERHPAPLAKGADRAAWTQAFYADLMESLNDYMGRHYRDSLERLEVSKDIKGQVLVRIANAGSSPVEGIRVEVAGGKLFMEGPPDVKLRSLGTRAMQIPAVAPGEKLDLFVLTTEEIGAGAAAPLVKVSSRGQPFPIAVRAPETREAKLKSAGWIAFGTLYAALILGGLFVKGLSLTGVRLMLLKPERKPAARAAGTAAPPAPLVRAPVEDGAWRRPDSA